MVVRADAPRVALRTLGCKVNRADTEALAEALALLGATVVDAESPAEAVVVNTCTVTAEADAKARKEVRRALGDTEGPVIVTGCLAAIDAEGLRTLGERVVVQADRRALPAAIAALLGVESGAGRDVPVAGEILSPGPTPGFRTRALVKVQEGCDNRCAFCIVPDARGLPSSVPAREILERVASRRAAGTSEIVLTGVNLGRYADAPDAPDLATLVTLLAETGIPRIRLSSIEPPDLTGRLLGVLAITPAVAPHLHVPLQSGSDRTLQAMGRRYDVDAYAEALVRARAAIPGLAVTTDVIVGFPGETDADFEASLEFVRSCAFTKLHVFRYSPRSGTPAAALPDQVPPERKASRAGVLRELSDALERAHAGRRAGEQADLLVERISEGVAFGTTGDHLHVSAELPGARRGELVPITLAVSDDGTLRGYYVG